MTISIRLDANLEHKFLYKVRKQKRSKSEVIRELIQNFIESDESKETTPWDIFEATLTTHPNEECQLPTFKSKADMKRAMREKVSQKLKKEGHRASH